MPSPAQIREQVTQKIIAALEAGTVPWVRPWRASPNCGNPTNVISRKTYRGVNVWCLELHRMRYGFTSKWFGTFDQVKALGGVVKKRPADVEPGQWGCPIVFYREIKKRVTDQRDEEGRDESFRLLRTYTVFCADQCEGLDQLQVKDEPDGVNPVADYEPVEQLIQASGADIRYGGDQAFYVRPVPARLWPKHRHGDFITVPHRKRFLSLAHFYAVVVHELAHHSEIRLGYDRKADGGYAYYELVAEMASAFLCTELGVPDSGDLSNVTAYLKGWLDAMRGDASYVFKASSMASKTADYLLSKVAASQEQGVAIATGESRLTLSTK